MRGARPYARPARLAPLPLAVLVVVVGAAVATRSLRPGAAPDGPSAPVTMTSAVPLAPSGLAAPLRSPPYAAGGPSDGGAPRMVHGGPRHLHRSAARGPRAARVGWRTQVGGAVAAQVTASPDEQTLYAATLDGSIVALAREDGAKRWTAALGDRVYSAPLVHEDGTLYVGIDGKKLVALGPQGAVLWRLEVDGEADSGAVFANDGTVIFAAGSYVHAARRGGDLAWRFAARGKVFTAPAVTDDGVVVFGSQDHRVYALGSGGSLAWSTDLGADIDGAPVIGDDGAVYVGTDRGEIVRLEERGKIGWRTPVGGYVRGVLSLARNGDILAGTYGPVPRVVRVGPEGGVRGAFAIQGTGAREFGIHGGPLEDAEGSLFFGAQDDAAYAIGPDGALRWRFETGADVDAPLTLLSDGSLIVPSEDGTVTMLLP
jgi:outer membrane protein assembly factor BamB